MSIDSSDEITLLLRAAKAGDQTALDRVFAVVYDVLLKIAQNRIRDGAHWTAEPNTLVHEAYLRLFKSGQPSWEDRHHFFFAAARAVSDILVERARRENAAKRGGGRTQLELHEDMAITTEPPDLIDLQDALVRLKVVHPQCYEVIMLRFFAGLNREETAEIMNISESAVHREWNFARAWLRSELERGIEDGTKIS